MSKFSVLPIVQDHYQTLSDLSGKWRPGDYLATIGLPAGLAASAWGFGLRLEDVSDLVVGVSILAGLLFALVIFVFSLRLQVAVDPRIPKGSHEAALLDELFRNVLYAVLAGLVATVVCVLAASTRNPGAAGELLPPSHLWTALTALTTTHLLVVILMCLKRIRAVYIRLTM